ncbi:tellurium resistance protein [Psychromarinibacter sp. C21-152]|uniref:Tellurium resistance protein n=1 Tax=Psychromarinibacter sediminicola TaxID=3033385 RepID=A0AAE3NP55_9RHOB|nr:tellurium resistance protein [Psychromarinibacter sediminicola]MDF0599427.1 tellurium resistance protein [Psychromarinibacter sediminicola]
MRQDPVQRVAFWRRTPPAVFPPLMGLFGLALAWRRASEAFDRLGWVSDLLLGAVTLLFLGALAAYAAKAMRRPGAVIEDLRVLPGRLGLAALSMSVMLLAAGLVPFAPGAARVVLVCGLGLHGMLAALVIYVLVASPPEGRMVTPAWHLTFVGFIVAPLAAVPLGLPGVAWAAFYGTLPVAALIFAVSAVQFATRPPPAPLRPLLAIHLAPMALFGTAGVLLGLTGVALAFCAGAAVLFVALVVWNVPLRAAGFSPLWGAFTFPLAAFAGLLLLLSPVAAPFRVTGGVLLVLATLLLPWIAAKVLQMWAKGALAVKTNSAVA